MDPTVRPIEGQLIVPDRYANGGLFLVRMGSLILFEEDGERTGRVFGRVVRFADGTSLPPGEVYLATLGLGRGLDHVFYRSVPLGDVLWSSDHTIPLPTDGKQLDLLEWLLGSEFLETPPVQIFRAENSGYLRGGTMDECRRRYFVDPLPPEPE